MSTESGQAHRECVGDSEVHQQGDASWVTNPAYPALRFSELYRCIAGPRDTSV